MRSGPGSVSDHPPGSPPSGAPDEVRRAGAEDPTARVARTADGYGAGRGPRPGREEGQTKAGHPTPGATAGGSRGTIPGAPRGPARSVRPAAGGPGIDAATPESLLPPE